jgi:hypothetical protein
MEESVSRWESSSLVSSEQRLNKRAASTTRCQARAAASRLEAPAELSDANKIACEDNGDAAAVQYCSFKLIPFRHWLSRQWRRAKTVTTCDAPASRRRRQGARETCCA